MKGFACRQGMIAFAVSVIAAGGAAGCGGTQSPRAVRLELTAPTEGAAVTVRSLKVFGTVDPPSAAVNVAGKHAHVANGVFARWIPLRVGLSHIKIVATAVGYAPAHLNIAVRSAPRAAPSQASRSGAKGGTWPISGTANPASPPAGSHYAADIQANFLRTCEAAAGAATGAAASCTCALSHLEARISQNMLEVTERAILNGQATVPQWVRDAVLACRRT
jgi:hypothetical protein